MSTTTNWSEPLPKANSYAEFEKAERLSPHSRESYSAERAWEAATANIESRTDKAIEIARSHSQTDGADHKVWVIDQMMRELLGDGYGDWITAYKAGEDGPNTYHWDEGIAP